MEKIFLVVSYGFKEIIVIFVKSGIIDIRDGNLTAYTEVLDELENFVQDKINILLKNKDTNIPHLNSILINKYRDGKDSIRPHRDSAISFGEEPTIIVISLGSTRDQVFKKNGSDKSEFKFTMADNSFFIMGGGSQKYFTHEIPKTDACGTRYSLTMREYINH